MEKKHSWIGISLFVGFWVLCGCGANGASQNSGGTLGTVSLPGLPAGPTAPVGPALKFQLDRPDLVEALEVRMVSLSQGTLSRRVPVTGSLVSLEVPEDDYKITLFPVERGSQRLLGVTHAQRRVFPVGGGPDNPIPVLCGPAPSVTDTTPAAPIAQGTRPNIVHILLDDLDTYDVGVYGSTTTQTPRLDQLAAEGMRFQQFYCNGAKCSPTRASILTSRLPGAFGWRDVVDNYRRSDGTTSRSRRGLPGNLITSAELLRSQGYDTCLVGKWHVGEISNDYLPLAQGFAHEARWSVNGSNSNQANGDGFYWGYNLFIDGAGFVAGVTPRPRLGQPGADDQYLNKALTDEAIAFLAKPRNGPFFLNLWHFSPHTPLHVPARFDNSLFGYDLTTNQGKTSAMVSDVDREIGRFMDELDQRGLASNTLVVVTSDNGGQISGNPTRRANLRGAKGEVFEGGIRSPCIARWPGTIAPNTLDNTVASTVDLLPTFAELAQVSPPANIVGRSLLSNLKQTGQAVASDLFWVAPRFQNFAAALAASSSYEQMDQLAVRRDNFKLVRSGSNLLQLFDLSTGSKGEFTDIAAARPDLVNDLMARFKQWHARVGNFVPAPTLTNSVLTMPFDARMDTVDADFSLAMDVRAETLGQQAVLASRPGSWQLLWSDDKLILKLIDDAPGGTLADREVSLISQSLTANATHRVAFTVYGHMDDKRIVSLYVDGNLAQRLLPNAYPAGKSLFAVVASNVALSVGANPDDSNPFLGSVLIPKLSTLAWLQDEL